MNSLQVVRGKSKATGEEVALKVSLQNIRRHIIAAACPCMHAAATPLLQCLSIGVFPPPFLLRFQVVHRLRPGVKPHHWQILHGEKETLNELRHPNIIDLKARPRPPLHCFIFPLSISTIPCTPSTRAGEKLSASWLSRLGHRTRMRTTISSSWFWRCSREASFWNT